VRAGVLMLPAAAASMVSFQLSPLLVRKIRPAYLIGGGLVVSVAGLLFLTRAGAASGLDTVVAGFAIINFGAGPLVALGTDIVVGSAPPEKAGSAAALNETSAEFGFAFGIATLGSIGAAMYRGQAAIPDGLPNGATAAARETIAGAVAVAPTLPGQVGDALLASARAAFTTSMHTVAAICAALLAVVAIFVAALLRHVPPTGEAHSDDVQQATSTAHV
jgi:DHA2 family multidrug resistance protein-like MFS transporter